MEFDADLDDRAEVHDGQALPDIDPRKDYAVRIDGPVAADVDGVLQQRWDLAIDTEEPFTQGNSTWTPSEPASPRDDGIVAQLQVTMPVPAPERSILESLAKAFANADDYIYVEDQYWRAPLLNEVLLETLEAKPWVKLVVVTTAVSILDPRTR